MVQEVIGVNEKEDSFEVKRPQPHMPKVQHIPHESLQSTETVPLEVSGDYIPQEFSGSVASESFSTKQALQVTESTVEQNVSPYEPKYKTPVCDQKEIIMESHALEVFNTNPNETESPMLSIEPSLIKNAAVKMEPLQHVSTEETHSGESVPKFYPEMIVATEVANTNLNSLNEYNTEVTTVIESHLDFVSKIPQYHTASPTITGTESHIVSAQPMVSETVEDFAEKQITSESIRLSLIENNSLQSYEQIILQEEVGFDATHSKLCQASPDYEGLSIASVEETLIHDKETASIRPHTNEESAQVTIEPESSLPLQYEVTSNETIKPLMQQKPTPKNISGLNEENFAYNIEETNVYETTSDRTTAQQTEIQKVEKVIALDKPTEIYKEFQPDIIGKHLILISHLHRHFTYYLTHRHHTNTSDTHQHRI